MRFGVEPCPRHSGLKRITAHFQFQRPRTIELDGERFGFETGEVIRLFYSYRHTPTSIGGLLRQHRLSVVEQWISPSEEEGVFLRRRVE